MRTCHHVHQNRLPKHPSLLHHLNYLDTASVCHPPHGNAEHFAGDFAGTQATKMGGPAEITLDHQPLHLCYAEDVLNSHPLRIEGRQNLEDLLNLRFHVGGGR